MILTEGNEHMATKITECACCGNRDSARFIEKNDGYICKTCGVWFRYETEEEKAGCMDGRRRLKNYRFDDARETFMEVLDKYPESIDALWGSLLARYGIVFVKGFFDDTTEPIYCFPEYDEYGGRRFRDERAYKKILRLLEERDEDFRLSDFYESKAKEIDRAIEKYTECKKNTDVDVFICVKISAATEENPGKSGYTKDYEYALKVYKDLQKRGVNAFFSFVTLKNNVESDDLIWVNLVKSKKMLLIGSAEEYLESVWVKSEWKRWLFLGREKDLYICSMKHNNEAPKSILPHELSSLHPQVYTLDTYKKMIDELCEKNEESPSATARSEPDATARPASPKDGKIVYSDGREEVLKYGIAEIKEKAYKDNKDVVGVILPESITKIGAEAFCGCAALASIKLPGCLDSIGKFAFYACKSLTEIILPKSVSAVGEYAFAYCSGIKGVTLPSRVASVGTAAFLDCGGIEVMNIPNSVENISGNPFGNCKPEIKISPRHKHFKVIDNNLYSADGKRLISYIGKEHETVFTVPEGVTQICGYAFYGAQNLRSVIIQNGVTSIGERAFRGCGELESAVIPKSVNFIAWRAFYELGNLKYVFYGGSQSDWEKIEIQKENDSLSKAEMRFGITPARENIDAYVQAMVHHDGRIEYLDGRVEVLKYGITEIGEYKYSQKKNIYKVFLPNSVKKICDCAFVESSLFEITIPDSVTEIGSSVFNFCKTLRSITIPDSVTKLGSSFHECSALKSATLSCGLTKIEPGMFVNSGLQSIVIPEGVTMIGQEAFVGCNLLKTAHIPKSVVYIGSGAFNYMPLKSLRKITYAGSRADWKKIDIVGWSDTLKGGLFRGAMIFYNCKNK